MTSSAARKITATWAILGLAAIGIAATPRPANAWWNHYGCCWGGVGIYVPPPVVVAPPVYAPAPAYFVPPARVWIPAHWDSGYRIPGHWS